MQIKIRNIYSNQINIIRLFTDGSANPRMKAGAWAACVVRGNDEHMISGTAHGVTHHAMEIQAVIEGLRYIRSEQKDYSQIVVFTDSEYVEKLPARRKRIEANHFMTSKGKAVKNHLLVKQLYDLLDVLPVEIHQVDSHMKKGHSMVTDYNRKVDKLSRELVRRMAGKD